MNPNDLEGPFPTVPPSYIDSIQEARTAFTSCESTDPQRFCVRLPLATPCLTQGLYPGLSRL